MFRNVEPFLFSSTYREAFRGCPNTGALVVEDGRFVEVTRAYKAVMRLHLVSIGAR